MRLIQLIRNYCGFEFRSEIKMIVERLAVIDGKVFVLVIVIGMHFLFVPGCLTCSLVRVVLSARLSVLW